jgi:hypothetical protein
MTSCDECQHHGSQARITITGLETYNGNFVVLSLGDPDFWGSAVVVGGQVALDMLCWECDQPDFRHGNYMAVLLVYDSANSLNEKYSGFIISKVISAGANTLQFAEFTAR